MSQKFGWITGRDIDTNSLAYGEVVLPIVFVRTHPFRNPQKAFEINHGEKVILLNHIENENGEKYWKIEYGEKEGWISDRMVVQKWASFIFIGNIYPQEVIQGIDGKTNIFGNEISISRQCFSITTQGSPENFNAIRHFAEKLAESTSISQTVFSGIPIRLDITHWIEIPFYIRLEEPIIGNYIRKDIGIQKEITEESFNKGNSFLTNMILYPHLFLSMNDYHQALLYPEISLIFLSRAIETIENYFEHINKEKVKEISREKLMREILKIDQKEVQFVMRHANDSLFHERHATKNGDIKPITQEVLEKCFTLTKRIITSFERYLKNPYSF